VLEHLPDLPKALKEIDRLLARGGTFEIVIPCEGGWAYGFARKISSERMFRKNFGMDYRPIIRAEHINRCDEIVAELAKHGWQQTKKSYFPLLVPIWTANLCLGMQFKKI
jgi:SAM-dependent methyltransferase